VVALRGEALMPHEHVDPDAVRDARAEFDAEYARVSTVLHQLGVLVRARNPCVLLRDKSLRERLEEVDPETNWVEWFG